MSRGVDGRGVRAIVDRCVPAWRQVPVAREQFSVEIGAIGDDRDERTIGRRRHPPNILCKFSGLASVCDPARPMTPQVRPYFEHCLECFGPARMMWGSDWPLCNLTFDLAAWVGTTMELLGELTESEQTTIATSTAQRIYRLG